MVVLLMALCVMNISKVKGNIKRQLKMLSTAISVVVRVGY